jgi:hypothetical protein
MGENKQNTAHATAPLKAYLNFLLACLPCNHRLNMELDLKNLFGLLCTAVIIG